MSATEKSGKQPSAPAGMRGFKLIVPLAVFAAIAVLLFVGLQSGDPSRLPSVLIGKPVPEFTLPPLEGLVRDGKTVPGFSSGELAKGKVSVVNVWASWCIPCHKEHPYLSRLAERSGATLFGLNQKDKTAAARRFLGRYGNPFAAVGVDRNGAVSIDWGVYGVPETFIVNGEGHIVHKHVGPIDDRIIEEELLPVIEKARAGT
jgi:cytochrome c biogenesis protein CcmG/thiol:disulfide interchange protein DsbE